MGETRKTRGSSADRELACAGAIGYDGPRIDYTGPEARLGTAAGEACERMATGLPVDLDKIARTHGVDRDSLGAAYAGGVAIWEHVGPWFPNAEAQVAVAGRTTVGTADLVSLEWDASELLRVAVLDFKLAMTATEHPGQLKAYALGLVDTHGMPKSGYVLAVEAHLMRAHAEEERPIIVHKFTADDLYTSRQQLLEQHGRAGRQFAPGPHCQYCPRRHDCEPRDAHLRASATALVESPIAKPVPRVILGAAYQRSRELARALREYDAALKLALEEGPIDTGDGVLELVESEQEVIRPSAIMDKLGGLDLDLALSCSKASLARAIKDVVPRGEAAACQRQMLDEVREQGGITVKTLKKVRVSK